MQSNNTPTPTSCDCCGSLKWVYEFTEKEIALGYCAVCGLHYIAPMPSREERINGIQECLFGSGQHVGSADLHRKAEVKKKARFQKFIELIGKFAPEGKWLDIGCGTGTLISEARKANKEVAGIELSPDRRRLAKELFGDEIYDKPIEMLNLAPESYAVVTMTDVFSHLTSPTVTISHVHKVLRKNGIMMLYTSEIGPGVKRYHNYFWDLGDHLYFLGEHTIERYCSKIGFELIYREKSWVPDFLFSRETFLTSGRSKMRNFIKKAFVYSPGVFPLLRWYMLGIKHKGNPCYQSTLLLKKVDK